MTATNSTDARAARDNARLRAEFDRLFDGVSSLWLHFTPGQSNLTIRIRTDAGRSFDLHASTWRAFVLRGWVAFDSNDHGTQLWRIET